jgi:hypothetical protein
MIRQRLTGAAAIDPRQLPRPPVAPLFSTRGDSSPLAIAMQRRRNVPVGVAVKLGGVRNGPSV